MENAGIRGIPILPEEIWNKIFTYFTHNELKAITFVSKSWNTFVSNSPQFYRYTKLKIDATSQRSFLDVMKGSSRKHLHVEIKYDNDRAVCFWRSPIFCFSCLTLLDLSFCTVEGSELLRMLRDHPTITALRLRDIEINRRKFFCEPLKLKLTELALQSFNESTDWILNHLNCSQVTNFLRIICSPHWRSDSVAKFLNRLEGNIDCLLIENINLDQASLLTYTRFSFKWNFLHFSYFSTFENPDRINMILKKFGDASAKGSTYRVFLPLHHRSDNNFLMSIQMLQFCKNISVCEFNSELLDYSSSAFKKFGSLDMIKCLKLKNVYCNNRRSELYEAFFSMFPCLESLSITFSNFGLFQYLDMAFISRQLRSVKILMINSENFTIDDFNIELFRNMRFPDLESIAIGPILVFARNPELTVVWLRNLLRYHRKLHSITFIGNTSNLKNPNVKQLLRNISQDFSGGSLQTVNAARIQTSRFSQLIKDNSPLDHLLVKETLKVYFA